MSEHTIPLAFYAGTLAFLLSILIPRYFRSFFQALFKMHLNFHLFV